ncbi:hypothetical protein CUMW_128370 [Citrus unshiu]|uniref:Leucine-rich repeat-containing N-terminal plant-type domain-containing protein n=1 Tax=Citrus unshiu TaxID=55188 RepID=A0A2H5PE67_CITUN|nr:hypothetical protein CUMW_128370 [Citrus unshiu]
MEENRFEGSIPSSLGNCKKLQVLNLSSNNLNGTIPKEVVSLSSLSISLVMSHNSLTGSLPPEVGKLTNLVELDVSYNRLSGEIPSSLDSCISLERLYLGNNSFKGRIPVSLKSLRGRVLISVPDRLRYFKYLKSPTEFGSSEMRYPCSEKTLNRWSLNNLGRML